MIELRGWTVWRVAREAGVRSSTVQRFVDHRMISRWAEWRIRQALSWLGHANTHGGQ